MTGLFDTEALLGLGERVVGRTLGLGADAAEAYVARGRSIEVEVERGRVTYTSANVDAGIGIRVIVGGRTGFAFTSDPGLVDDAAGQAISISRLSPDRGLSLPARSASYPDVGGLYDPRLETMEPPEAVEMAGELIDSASEVHEGIIVAGGGVGLGVSAGAVVSSEGIAAASQGTSLSLGAYVVLRDATISTGHEFMPSRARDVDALEVGRAAAQMAVDAQGAEPLERGGELAIVFRPVAFAELLGHTVVPSIIGDAVQRGESAYSGRDGERVATGDLTLLDDPTLVGGLQSDDTDDEGVASRRNVIIDRGVLKGFLYDSFSGQEYGLETTASAVRSGGWKSQPEAGVSNIVLEMPTRGTLDELVAEVDRGILVHDVLGAHTANVSSMDFSVNSTMPFEVRSGEVVGPRSPVMLGGNVGTLLERLIGGGGVPRQCPGALSSGSIVVPWVAAEGVTVTP